MEEERRDLYPINTSGVSPQKKEDTTMEISILRIKKNLVMKTGTDGKMTMGIQVVL